MHLPSYPGWCNTSTKFGDYVAFSTLRLLCSFPLLELLQSGLKATMTKFSTKTCGRPQAKIKHPTCCSWKACSKIRGRCREKLGIQQQQQEQQERRQRQQQQSRKINVFCLDGPMGGAPKTLCAQEKITNGSKPFLPAWLLAPLY